MLEDASRDRLRGVVKRGDADYDDNSAGLILDTDFVPRLVKCFRQLSDLRPRGTGGRTIHCPVRALENWVATAGIEHGPVFRSVDRHRRVSGRLSGKAVSLIIRGRLSAAGFDPTGYSGHSLRAGFATSATRAGVSTFKIRQQTGHASDAMLSRYVRDGELFLGNAAGILL